MQSTMKDILLEHTRRYPQMEPVDYVKLVYHSEFGGGHMIWDRQQALLLLQQDIRRLGAQTACQAPLFEAVGGRMYRMNLSRQLFEIVSPATVTAMFIRTGEMRRGRDERFARKLKQLQQYADEGLLAVSGKQMAQYLDFYVKNGYEPVHHSQAYRQAYHPCYRLVSARFVQYFEAICAVERLLSTHKRRPVVAIDGPAAAGKSTLAALLGQLYDCNVFHMDDFRLNPADTFLDRIYGQALCADLDTERFRRQVVSRINARLPYMYERKNPYTGVHENAFVMPKRLQIFEGTYAMYPAWADVSHLKIFMDITADRQKKRLAADAETRSRLAAEELYFDVFCVGAYADIRLLTK